MANTKTETYYTACVRLERVVGGFGTVLTDDDGIGWLGEDSGYNQVYSTPFPWSAKSLSRFLRPQDWDGMPWYCKIKPGTLQVFKHTVTTLTEVEEIEIK